MKKPIPYWIALGSNLGDRVGHIDAAVARLVERVGSVELSSLYETKPMYLEDQRPFVNAVACVFSTQPPRAMLDVCQQIERAGGRVRAERNGPRTIDLDIVAAGRMRHEDADTLVIPHPRLAERAFVLVPLIEVALRWKHPVLEQSAAEILHNLGAEAAAGPQRLRGPRSYK